MPSRLAVAISKMEGFGIPGAIPTTHHNPGDLRHSPHSQHSPDAPNAIGQIDTDAHGWADLERQLAIFGRRGYNMMQLISTYAPSSENNTANYLKVVCDSLQCLPSDKVAQVLQS